MGRNSNKYKAWDISDYVSCLSILRNKYTFKLVEEYALLGVSKEFETELKTKDLSLAFYNFFLALDKPHVQRVQLFIVDNDNPLFPILVSEKYVYQSR